METFWLSAKTVRSHYLHQWVGILAQADFYLNNKILPSCLRRFTLVIMLYFGKIFQKRILRSTNVVRKN